VTGENEVTEASCARAGVIKSKVHGDKWKEWGLCKGVTFDFVPGDDPEYRPTLRKGDSGPYVRIMQGDLIKLGYDVGKTGADGKFGANTEKAVKAFQADHPPLVSDGICGPKTWEAIEKALEPQPGPEPGTETYTVTIPGVTKEQAEELCSKWSGATMKKD
jgi:uncharacterized protein YndB with AHSA1/START domain